VEDARLDVLCQTPGNLGVSACMEYLGSQMFTRESRDAALGLLMM